VLFVKKVNSTVNSGKGREEVLLLEVETGVKNQVVRQRGPCGVFKNL
jgi:hypothetical protein